jgi:biopolymer transport protein ExbB
MRASSIFSRLVAPLAAIIIVLGTCVAAPSAAFAQASAPAPVLNAASGAPATAPAVTLPPITPPASIANPYGLRALWEQGDWVARATLLILAIMSLGSWYVLISKLIAQSRMGGQGRAANLSFWKADTIRGGAESLQKASPYRFIAESALEATRKHDGLIGLVDLNTWVA